MKLAQTLFLLSSLSSLALATACSAGSGSVVGLGGSSRSGVASGQAINAISDADRAAICDWVAESNGGYGGSKPKIQCSGFEITPKAPKSQAVCVEDLAKSAATCTATVGQVEECLVYLQDNPCGTDKSPPACAALMSSSCMGKTTTVTVVEERGRSGRSSDDAQPDQQ